MLILQIKRKWFDMIVSGEKREEYRDIKPYYISRFRDISYDKRHLSSREFLERLKYETNRHKFYICLRNGYSENSPSFVVKCTLSVGTGKEEWGAEKGKEYFILTIHEIQTPNFINNSIERKDCGNCGFDLENSPHYKYCPNCGFKIWRLEDMRNEETD